MHMHAHRALAACILLTACGGAPRPVLHPAPASAPAPSKPSEAVAPKAKAPPRDIEAALALVEKGRTAQREGGEDAATVAVGHYKQALEADPQCAAALWELGWSYQVLGDYDAALKAWDALRQLQPDYPELADNYPILVMRRDQDALLKSLPNPGELPPPEEEPREGPTISFTAVGDVQMGRAWPEEQAELPPDNGAVLFTHVRDILAAGEITFGNAETVLADSGESKKCGKRSKVCYAFRAPAAFAKTLAEVGFDVMSSANNHSGDFGPEGRAQTLASLDAAGIRHSGPVGDIASWEQNGLKIALIAFAPGDGLYRVQDIDTAKKVVAAADKDHDLVIVSFHGGAEGRDASRVPKEHEIFYGEDRGDVYAFAHAVIDAGADLVLGHGPHVLRAMEVYHGRFIAYSLGNFCAWHGFNLSGPLGISTILQVTLATNGVATSAKLIPLTLEQPGVPQPDPKGRAIEVVRQLSQRDIGASLFNEDGTWRRTALHAEREP